MPESLPPWQRQEMHVHVLLQAHPLLSELLLDGSSSVWTDGDERGISVFLVLKGKRIREARLDQPDWWLPETQERGAELAQRLAIALRGEGDARP